MCRKKDNTDDCPVCPKITSFTPGHGKYKDTIRINGENFKTDPDGLSLKIDINGMSAQIVNITNDQAVVIVPNKCGTGVIRAYYDQELYGESETSFLYDAVGITSTYAGKCGGTATANANPLLAEFNSPDKIFLDDSRGYVYVVNDGNGTVSRVSSTGVTIIISGTNYIQAGACDASGIIYLAFSEHIAKVESTAGTVMLKTIAGIEGSTGHVDGKAATAKFNGIRSMIIDNAGNFYIGESTYIRKIDAAFNVSTIAGGATGGFLDGPALSAKFNSIVSLSLDKNQNLYIADWENSRIRKLSGGVVSTIAGSGVEGVKNGIGTAANLQKPRSITINNDDSFLYFSDSFISSFLRKMDLKTGEVSYFTGDLTQTGSTDGPIETATYNEPKWLVYTKKMDALYVVEFFNCKVRKISFE